MDEAVLCEQFVKAAQAFGYEKADASVVESAEMGIKWVRGGDFIDFMVPDYLLAITAGAAYDLADGLMRRITGAGITAPDFREADRQMSSEAFARANQGEYIERNGYREAPAAWLEYQRLAREQGVSLPAGVTARIGDGDTSVSMRLVVVGSQADGAPIRDQLEYIESQVALIAQGLRGCNAASARARYVEVA